MSAEVVSILAAALGGFLIGWRPRWSGLKRMTLDRLDPKPGDVIVVSYDGTLSDQVAGRVRSSLEGIFDGKVRVVVMDQGARVSIVRMQAMAGPPQPVIEGRAGDAGRGDRHLA